MKNKVIIKIIEERAGKLEDLANKITLGFDKETIHEFRTTTKQFRSFLRLLRTYITGKHLKLSKKVKHLYTVAGNIREAQLELEIIDQRQLSFPAYSDGLHNTISLQQKEWAAHHQKNIFSEWRDKLTSEEFPDLEITTVKNFVSNKTISIIHLLKLHGPTDVQLHNARKAAKDILYIIKVIKKEWPEGHAQLKYVPMSLFEKITDSIGVYHDGCVLLEHLSAFSSPALQVAETESIHAFSEMRTKTLAEERSVIFALVHELATYHTIDAGIAP